MDLTNLNEFGQKENRTVESDAVGEAKKLIQ